MRKIVLVVLIVLMFGMVSADHSLSNVVGISLPSDVVAGSEFEASFSFEYLTGGDNEDGSPLIIRLNISSDDVAYPVWKGDFEISGRVEKSWFFNMLTETVEFNCSEEYEQTIEHPLDAQNVTADDGVFYCYNEEGDLMLEERDEVYLDITSHQAIYPGQYDLTASMFYLSDERVPFVNITNKEMFDLYYREIDNVEITATIDDGSEIVGKWGTAFLGYENLTFPWTHNDYEGLYYFSRNTPEDIIEGDYPLFIFAKDGHNNTGNDSVVLKIDRTGPNITLIQPNGSVYDEVIPVRLNVTDEKSGVDNSSVFYKISEIVNGTFCPSTGIVFGGFSCYNSGWMQAGLNVTSEYYGDDFNATHVAGGSYYFEAKAEDILGNEGVLK
ncbi:hypothetical protein KAJ38_02135 [Candidatus Pacearchaeota archaeon]|nr:hypothetical protein [Candidatus Pacearchaeota archaeon]